MPQLIVICATVLLLALIPALLAFDARRRPAAAPDPIDAVGPAHAFPYTAGDLVVVHKLDGQSLQGAFALRTDDGDLVLDDVTMLAGGAEHDVKGRWTIPANRIDCVQGL